MRGIVRRIDELGRIVIPKEIRSLMRIKDGDMIEITFNEEVIKLNKYSKVKSIEEIGNLLCSVLYISTKKFVLLCDTDKFICSCGIDVKDVNISDKLVDLLNDRKIIDSIEGDYSYYLCPIIVNSDVVGGIILLSKDNEIVEIDRNLVKMTKAFLEKYIEE